MPTLIVNADDFGRAVGVNRGILEAHLRGIVTSTTAMMNYPDAQIGLEDALDNAPELGLGVHLNLTSGQALSPRHRIRTLVNDDGLFHPHAQIAGVFRQWSVDDLRCELSAQVERFVSLTGKRPSHLDSHYHVAFLFPAPFQVTLELAAEYDIPLRRPPSFDAKDRAAQTITRYFPALGHQTACDLLHEVRSVLDTQVAPRWPDRLDLSFFGPRARLDVLQRLLANLPAECITELMCHPGYVDDRLAGSNYKEEREEEVRLLTHPDTLTAIRDKNVRLVSFLALSTVN